MAIIRPLQKGDQEQVAKLFLQLTKDFSVFNIDELLLDNAVESFVIEEGKEVVGFAALVTYYLPSAGKLGNVEDVVIAEKFRNKGFGKMIMKKIISVAKEKNIIELQLTSSPEREVARVMYTKLGFHVKDTNVFVMDL